MNVSVQLNYSHGYFTNYGLILGKPQPWLFLQSTFPQTGADIIAHLLFVFVIHTRQQVKHEINSYQLHSHGAIVIAIYLSKLMGYMEFNVVVTITPCEPLH